MRERESESRHSFPHSLALSLSPQSSVLLFTAGDPTRLTGGNLYIRRMVSALRGAGLRVEQLTLSRGAASEARAANLLAALRPGVVLVDSVALTQASRLLPAIEQAGSRLALVMLMFPSEIATGMGRQVALRAEADLFPRSDLVIAVSEPLRSWLVARGAAPRRTAVIPPGRNGIAPSGRAKPRRDGPFRFLCVANWSANKGIHDAVRALAMLATPARLDLVGDEGSAAYRKRVLTLVDRLGLAGRVVRHRVLTGKALEQSFGEASALLLPSRSEGAPTVVAEALDRGLPIVGYDTPVLAWMTGHDEPAKGSRCALLVPAGDIKALASAMDSVARDKELHAEMSAAAARRAQALPTWSESTSRFVALIHSMINAT